MERRTRALLYSLSTSIACLGGCSIGVEGCGNPEARLEPTSSAPLAGRPLVTTQSAPRPAPRATADPRPARMAAEIAALEAATEDEDPTVDRDLDDRIAHDRDALDSLDVTAETERFTLSDELSILQSRQQQDSLLLRERLSSAADAVRRAETELAARRQALAMTVLPEDTDVMRNARAAVADGETTLANERARYEDLLAARNAAPEAYFEDQSRELDSIRARHVELAEISASMKADLEEALTEKRRLVTERTNRAARLAHLREELSKTGGNARD